MNLMLRRNFNLVNQLEIIRMNATGKLLNSEIDNLATNNLTKKSLNRFNLNFIKKREMWNKAESETWKTSR